MEIPSDATTDEPEAWTVYRPEHSGLTCEGTMTLEHGRTRYTRGCRCAVCKAAERDYQRDRYRRQRGLPVDPPALWEPSVINLPSVSSPIDSVVVAVRAELDAAPGAAERPGLSAVALALAAILDDAKHIASQPAAARQLAAILGALWQPVQRRGKLAVVKAMANQGHRTD